MIMLKDSKQDQEKLCSLGPPAARCKLLHPPGLPVSIFSLSLSPSLSSRTSRWIPNWWQRKIVASETSKQKFFSRLDNCIRIPASHGFDSSYPHSSCILDHEAILTLKACQAITTHHRIPSLETGPTSKCAPTVRAQRHMRAHTERAHARKNRAQLIASCRYNAQSCTAPRSYTD